MLIRMNHAYGTRIGDDPTALAHLRAIEESLRDGVNAGIAYANRRTDQPYSLGDMAKVLGITRPGMYKRVKLGETVITAWAVARSNGGVVRMADVRKARAARLAEAGVADRTSLAREL